MPKISINVQYAYKNMVYFNCAISCLGKCNVAAQHYGRVAMDEWLARLTPNHKIVGSSPAQSQSAHQKSSGVGYVWRQWCLGSLSCK